MNYYCATNSTWATDIFKYACLPWSDSFVLNVTYVLPVNVTIGNPARLSSLLRDYYYSTNI